MQKILFIIALLTLFFSLSAAPGRKPVELDAVAALNIDVAPFGIERKLAGGALFLWAGDGLPVTLGGDAQAYAHFDCFELGSHLLLRVGHPRASLFGGAGMIHLEGTYFGHELSDWYREVVGGVRLAIHPHLVLTPMAVIRIKEDDTDTNLIFAAGLNF